jgi:hypothetical protein
MTSPVPHPEGPAGELPPVVAALVVKSGVSLGGLPLGEQAWAFALAALALPGDGPWTEKALNDRLRAVLDGPLACLATDHVELRRWLVDSGWLQRDGYGREYTMAPAAARTPLQQEQARALGGRDLAAWVAERRAALAAARAERRARWAAAGGDR